MIRRGEIYQLPIWKLIVDVYSFRGRGDVIVVTLHESDLRTSVIFKQHSELEITARELYLLHLLFGCFILFPNSQFQRINCADTNTQMAMQYALCYFILIIYVSDVLVICIFNGKCLLISHF